MYANTAAYDTYRQVHLTTAPPEKLVLMLYDGAIRFLKEAKLALANRDIEKAHSRILKAENIITELRLELDMSYEISESLAAIYDYMNATLIKANIKKDAGLIDEVIDMLVQLKDTWAQAMMIAKRKTASGQA